MCVVCACVSDVFVLESNASATGVGAVLSVRKDFNQWPFSHIS